MITFQKAEHISLLQEPVEAVAQLHHHGVVVVAAVDADLPPVEHDERRSRATKQEERPTTLLAQVHPVVASGPVPGGGSPHSKKMPFPARLEKPYFEVTKRPTSVACSEELSMTGHLFLWRSSAASSSSKSRSRLRGTPPDPSGGSHLPD